MRDMVILINFLPSFDSSYENKGAAYPSTSILLIGSYLKKNGYNVRIIDGGFYEDYTKKLKSTILDMEDNIVFVGMSVMVTQIPFALEASKIIKRINQRIPIVWGGPHPTLYPEETLRDDHVDIVAINEGTSTALNIAHVLKEGLDLESIHGIGYKDADKTMHFTPPSSLDDINTLPFIDYSLIEIEQYIAPINKSVYKREFPYYEEEIRIIPIITGLGCAYQCQFCINVILKRKYRYRSARVIVDEIKRLQSQYKANTFLFFDEDFFINKKRVIELISICEEEKVNFNIRAWCRVDHFKESYLNVDLLKRLSNIGHISLVMGGESASPERLIDLKKGITPEQIINSLKVITESGKKIFPRYSFMVGLENETMAQIRDTYVFCMKMRKINPSVDIAGPFIFRLYPGSPIFNRITANYHIKIPTSLESWSTYMQRDASLEEMPWTPEEFQKKKNLISFYSNWFGIPGSGSRNFWGFKKLTKMLLCFLCNFRIKHFFFAFPFEYWMYSVLKTRLK